MWSRSPVRVLIVDDDRNEAESLLSLVEQLGCRAEVANSGAQALDVANRFHPQVVIVDIVMPVMDGYQTIVEMKKHPWARHTRFVAHPLSQDPLVSRVLESLGFHARVPKPATAEAFESVLIGMRNPNGGAAPTQLKRRHHKPHSLTAG